MIAARQVKAINPLTKILYYRNVLVHYGSYAANQGLEDIPGALLEDPAGDQELVRHKSPAYDLSNPELRNWWVENCKLMTVDIQERSAEIQWQR